MINGPSSVAKALNDSNNILKYIIEKGNQNWFPFLYYKVTVKFDKFVFDEK